MINRMARELSFPPFFYCFETNLSGIILRAFLHVNSLTVLAYQRHPPLASILTVMRLSTPPWQPGSPTLDINHKIQITHHAGFNNPTKQAQPVLITKQFFQPAVTQKFLRKSWPLASDGHPKQGIPRNRGTKAKPSSPSRSSRVSQLLSTTP